MATSYDEIYDRALYRFRAYDLTKLTNSDMDRVLRHFLDSAVSDFAPICLVDLNDRDEAAAEFTETLDNEVQEILASGMAYHWLSAQILDQELLRNALSTKDYTYFSPANLLRESQALRDAVRKEYRDRITHYSYQHGDIGSLSVDNVGG